MIAKILDKAKKPALVMVEKRDKLTRKQEYHSGVMISGVTVGSVLMKLSTLLK